MVKSLLTIKEFVLLYNNTNSNYAFLVYGLQHNKNMSRSGGFKKSCPACRANIFNGYKVCPMCKAPQPQKFRLKKKKPHTY